MNAKSSALSQVADVGQELDRDVYNALYQRSVDDPDGFWTEHAHRIDWMKPFQTVRSVNFSHPDVSIEWFGDGTLNACANCVDRHLDTRADDIAIIFEADDPDAPTQNITYRELHERVSRFANTLKKLGVTRGDRVIRQASSKSIILETLKYWNPH